MQLEEFLAHIRIRGDYENAHSAAQAAQAVLDILGAHLVGADLTDTVAVLPPQCTPILVGASPASEPLTPDGFIAAVAERTHTDRLGGRRHAIAVLSTVAVAADEALLARLLTQLPTGYGELFARTQAGMAPTA